MKIIYFNMYYNMSNKKIFSSEGFYDTFEEANNAFFLGYNIYKIGTFKTQLEKL